MLRTFQMTLIFVAICFLDLQIPYVLSLLLFRLFVHDKYSNTICIIQLYIGDLKMKH